jgi:hypothetical protein
MLGGESWEGKKQLEIPGQRCAVVIDTDLKQTGMTYYGLMRSGTGTSGTLA